MANEKMIDHLFRHQYGKMVSIFTRIFGLVHLETIEDAIQDTFIKAVKSWQMQVPENPEAWLTQATKHRIIDLLRKMNAEDQRIAKIQTGISTYAINELFTVEEIEDSLLRMIFTACNPILNSKDQIAFALKTISGFSRKEIATALLLKEETIKKRLSRARKTILQNSIPFEIPKGKALQERLSRVLEVLYLIFNEGFHSSKKDLLIREELCGEAVRLVKCVLKNPLTKTPNAHALFALFCFQVARLKSRLDKDGELINLKEQDRTLWYFPITLIGHESMEKAMDTDVLSPYHYEAAIAAEHLQAPSYAQTNWDRILQFYESMNVLQDSPYTRLNIAIVQLERKNYPTAKLLLDSIDSSELEQRAYLFLATLAEYEFIAKQSKDAINYIDQAIDLAENLFEKNYLKKRRQEYYDALNQ